MTRLPALHSTDANAALGFAQRLADITSKLLGDPVLAVILHGSLTFEDYVPGPSDIDLLAIVDRPLSDCEIESLTRTIAAERPRAPAPADLRFVTRAVAATPPETPRLELYIRLGLTGSPEVEVRRREPDLIVELSICRQQGDALLGPSPPQLIGEVPSEWVLRAGDAQLARWQLLTNDAPYAALMALTACRIWRFSEERAHCSKAAAGAWALARDPSLTAARDALRQRAGYPVRIAPTEIGRLLRIVRTRIARKAGVRRRLAPHQLRHAHAVEMARECVPLIVIQRQLGHTNLGITSIYLQGIDNAEIIDAVHARRAPMVGGSLVAVGEARLLLRRREV